MSGGNIAAGVYRGQHLVIAPVHRITSWRRLCVEGTSSSALGYRCATASTFFETRMDVVA